MAGLSLLPHTRHRRISLHFDQSAFLFLLVGGLSLAAAGSQLRAGAGQEGLSPCAEKWVWKVFVDYLRK